MSNSDNFTIKVAPDALPRLRDDLTSLYESIADRNSLKEDLDWILKDHRIDPIECPAFYDIAKKAAGEDMYLDTGEERKLVASLGAAMIKMLKTSDAPPSAYISIFDNNKKGRLALIRELEDVSEKVTKNIEFFESLRAELKEKELSYLNFVNAENMLGLSALISHEGRPFSALEIDALSNFISWLHSVWHGIEILLESEKQGYFPEDSPLVREFLNSPFIHLTDINAILNRRSPMKDSEKMEVLGLFALGLAKKAAHCGSTTIAADIMSSFEGKIDRRHFEIAEKFLPGRFERFASGPLKTFANATCSLDSLAALATGGVVGGLVGKSLKGSAVVAGLSAKAGIWKMFLPGVLGFGPARAGEYWRGMKGLRFVGNLLFEGTKLQLYTFVGSSFFGETGSDLGSDIYMFGLGAQMRFHAAFRQAVHAELLGLSPPDRISSLVSEGITVRQLSEIAELVRTNPPAGSFSVPRWAPASEMTKRMTALRASLLKEAETNAKISAGMEAELSKARAFAERYPETGSELVKKIEAAGTGPDTSESLKLMRDLNRAAEKEVRSLRARLSPSTPVRRRTPAQKNPFHTREERLAERPSSVERPVEELKQTPVAKPAPASCDPAPVSAAPASPVRPERIDGAFLRRLLGDGIEIDAAAEKEIIDTYNTTPGLRRAMIARLTDLEKRAFRNGQWKRLRIGRGKMRARVGIRHRLLVEHTEGNKYRIYSLSDRSDLKLKDWLD